MSENHTPTPWRLDHDGLQIRAAKAGPLAIATATGGTYAGLRGAGTIDRDTMKANAELIVTAVNSYASSQAEIERLTALLKSARSYVSDVASNNSAFLQEEAGHDLARIDAALSGSKE